MIPTAAEADGSDRATAGSRILRVVHLFPDLLSVYGDAGNVQALIVRSRARGIIAERAAALADTPRLPTADIYVIGGGQDRDQLQVERSLRRFGDALMREVADGAAVLAVCGGYQSLGLEYRILGERTIHGPGVLDVKTIAGSRRLVGPVVAHLEDPLFGPPGRTIVGFENHSGRTTIGSGSRSLARVEIGHGNGDDGTEGVLETPGARGLRGLRIGTYLHGPLLPRNPHLSDVLIAAGLSRTGQPTHLAPLDDRDEWAAHDRYVERCRRRTWTDRLPGRVRRIVEPARDLVGF